MSDGTMWGDTRTKKKIELGFKTRKKKEATDRV